MYEEGPLGEPVFTEDDFPENGTYYDAVLIAAEPQERQQMWLGWSVAFYIIAFYATLVFIPTVVSANVRKSPFNWYLIFLMAPDVLATWGCATYCFLNYRHGHYIASKGACYFQSWFLIAFVSINAWLNARVAMELLKMLQSSANYIKYQVPTKCQVTLHCLSCYVIGAFVSSWGVYRASSNVSDSSWPHNTRLAYGLVCVPQPYDDASMIFFYLVYFPALVGIPFAYVCWAAYSIWKNNLLPKQGRRRVLGIFFFRVCLLFIFMWLPCIVFMFVTAPWTDAWVEWFGGLWGHLQVLASATICVTKTDIWQAQKEFYRCLLVDNTNSTHDDEIAGDDDDDRSWITNIVDSATSTTTTALSSVFERITKGRNSLEKEVQQLKSDLAQWEGQEEQEQQGGPRMERGLPMSLEFPQQQQQQQQSCSRENNHDEGGAVPSSRCIPNVEERSLPEDNDLGGVEDNNHCESLGNNNI